jgi:hypothetical protein
MEAAHEPPAGRLDRRLDGHRAPLAALKDHVGAGVAWLIADHELWERRTGPAARQGLPIGLYNAATVLAVTLGVLCLYGALLVLNFLAAELFVVDQVLQQSLQHSVSVREHALLAWVTTSAAVVGGALGSGLEIDEAVRRAACGNREAERRGQDAEPGHQERWPGPGARSGRRREPVQQRRQRPRHREHRPVPGGQLQERPLGAGQLGEPGVAGGDHLPHLGQGNAAGD